METSKAKELVKNTFENPFNKEQFCKLVQNILNNMEKKPFPRIQVGQLISEGFRDFIKSLDRIGQYKITNKNKFDEVVDILIVYLKKETSLKRARATLRNYIAKYLTVDRQRQFKDGALVAFVSPDEDDWRFSFIKIDYKFNKQGKVKDELTPARRYSFLVGKNESSHTAQSCLLPLLEKDSTNPTLEDLEQAFSVEKVTKEFFEKYRILFQRLKKTVDNILKVKESAKKEFERKHIRSTDFVKKLLGQIVFLYFLQKKGWFGVQRGQKWGDGSKNFLRDLFKQRHDIYKSYGGKNQKTGNFFNSILEPLFYEALGQRHTEDYYSRFDRRIPFLNGGLFEPIKSYDWVNTDILLPDNLFSNENKTTEGDIGDGILDIFNRYNFTVNEDEPLDKEVAVDPEMLGKVFENLLEVKDRKSRGTYYTPREIVHYMCQQSLINYLHSTLLSDKRQEIQKPDIETLIKISDSSVEHDTVYQEKKFKEQNKKSRYEKPKLPLSIVENADLIDKALANIRICDPAVGSGAFPVGMMNEIVRVRNALTPFIQESSSYKALSSLKKQGITSQLIVQNGYNNDRTFYHFKRHAIEHSLYGVDIDPGAIEIAKLRLWLSLVVDEEDRNKVQPLPNLDYKMVCGDSLLRVNKDDGPGTPDMFHDRDIKELHKKKQIYFNETSTSKKQKLKQEINQFIGKIKVFDFEFYFSEVFQEKEGFDVVISNPPYISHDEIPNKKIIKKYKVYNPFSDLYCYFLEIALNIQNKIGVLCYITSNSYLRSEYGTSLRKYFVKKNYILNIINIENFQLFFSAIVNTSILISKKKNVEKPPKCLVVNAAYKDNISFENFIKKNTFQYTQNPFYYKYWYLLKPKILSIKEKIESKRKTLEMYNTKIRLGIATGANNVFIIDEKQKNRLIDQDNNNKNIIKPVLRGKNIFKFKYQHDNQYIILAKNGINIKKDYPLIYRYFDSYGESFKKRGAKGEHWSNLRNTAFLEDFKKEKIIWIELTNENRFALCSEEIYLLNSAYFLLPPKEFTSKYILALLNSNLIKFYLSLIAETSGMGIKRWINNYVKMFPIAKVSVKEQNLLVEIVNKIHNINKLENHLKTSDSQLKIRKYKKNIDQIVYKLYGLTKEEIKIIEQETRA